MIKKLLLLSFIAFPFLTYSQASDPAAPGQNPFRNDPNARMAYNRPYDLNAEGSPFFTNDYVKTEVTLVNGTVFKDVKVKFNIMDNEVFFLSEGQQEMITSSPVKRLRFNRLKEDESGETEEVVIESFNSPVNTKGAPVYQVIYAGKAKLLKQVVSSYSDVRKYPEGNMARVYKKKISYYAAIDDQAPVKFEKNKADVLALFPNKQTEMKGFMEKEKIKCRTDLELFRVFDYYSSLN